jgi:hypothetical protein
MYANGLCFHPQSCLGEPSELASVISRYLTAFSRKLYRDVLVQIWSPLSHKRIVPLLGVCTNDGLLPAYEIPSYTLGNIVEYNRQCHNVNKLHQIMQIAEGLSYMHDNGVTHGNICPVRSFAGSSLHAVSDHSSRRISLSGTTVGFVYLTPP